MHHFKPNQVILYHFIFTLIIVDPNKYYVDAVYPHKLPTESQNWDAFGVRVIIIYAVLDEFFSNTIMTKINNHQHLLHYELTLIACFYDNLFIDMDEHQ